jgi:4-amino-4-deoxy-L-arabinose transferase-like glycosyltransferase
MPRNVSMNRTGSKYQLRMTTQMSHSSEWWSSFRPYLLAIATIFCLVPFSGKAFHLDDTLFLYSARQITQHPLDPYGFEVNWYRTPQPMWMQTMNPPLAAYAIAAASTLVGWSERPLYLLFLLPALVVVLGTYHLARRLTSSPMVAAAATLLTPVLLVSATSLMCDTPMLALWMVALILWIEGMDRDEPLLLTAAALLIGFCALTKYFGIALVGLLLVYSWVRRRRLGEWAWYLLIPILILAAYQEWTRSLNYGHMFGSALRFARSYRRDTHASLLADGLVDLSFLGGCVLPGLLFAPFLWSRKRILMGAAFSGLAGLLIGRGWVNLGESVVLRDYHEHGVLVGIEAAFFIGGGLSILGLAVADLWKSRDADSVLLAAWVLGTFFFAGFLNWTNNGRSILPLVPAAGILLARRVERLWAASSRRRVQLAMLLALSGAMSLWVAVGDASVANSAREAANVIHDKTQDQVHGKIQNQAGTVWFEGHWGFQYYMESFGARAVDIDSPELQSGDSLAIPAENSRFFHVRPRFVAEDDVIQIATPYGVSTMQPEMGAGFYSSDNGPLPFVIGPVPAQRYDLLRLAQLPEDWAQALAPQPKLPLR